MNRLPLAFLLALIASGQDLKKPEATKTDDKPQTVPVTLKVDVEKADAKPESPMLVRLAFKITLPCFRIFEGLNPKHPAQRLPIEACSAGREREETIAMGQERVQSERVFPKADDMINALKPATQFSIQKGDDTHLLFFCAAKSCSAKDEQAIREAVNVLASAPSPRYFADVKVPAKVSDASALANAIGPLSQGAAGGRVLRSGTDVRIETDTKLDDKTIAKLRGDIESSSDASIAALKPLDIGHTAVRIALPTFCLSGNLTAPPQIGNQCNVDAQQRLAATANGKDIAEAVKMEKITVTADNAANLLVSCGGAPCAPPTVAMINETAQKMAWPNPAYVQELIVLPHTEARAAEEIAKWSNHTIKAHIIEESKILLESSVPINPGDYAVYDARLREEGFGPTPGPPVDRLFYTDAEATVKNLSAIPAPIAGKGAGSTYGNGMVPVGDSVVLAGDSSVTDGQRVRLLTLLDLPRPEVLMNLWSLQESNPNAKEITANSTLIRSTVALHNEALQNAIEYGWSYLSQQMKKPTEYFDQDFHDYLTQRYVADSSPCTLVTQSDGSVKTIGCIDPDDRTRWKICKAGQYCLGYANAFEPAKPTLTNILLALMAAKDPLRAVFTTLGCMEGKFEVYGEACFQDRQAISLLPLFVGKKAPTNQKKIKADDYLTKKLPTPTAAEAKANPADAADRECLRAARKDYMSKLNQGGQQPSCEDLDRAALEAQRRCKVPVALPLSCFTIQAAKSFVPFHGFSTFTADQLNGLAEENIPDRMDEWKEGMDKHMESFSTSPLGLLRSTTANFLFQYKIAQEFPKEFSPYALSHSAQEFNAQLNPLVVAFNEDVSVFSEDLRQGLETNLSGAHLHNIWDPHNKSVMADGSITVRGISGVESFVDTSTMSAFNAAEYQTLPQVLNNLAGLTSSSAPSASSTTTTSSETTNGNTVTSTSTTAPTATTAPPPLSSSLLSLLPGGLTKASLPVALASAIAPTPATAQIGRQLTFQVTPHSLPGASSAELDVNLSAQEEGSPTLYSDHGATSNTDPTSRIATHKVVSRVRVESVKLFEVSSFSALIERPRTNVPLLPLPFIEVPVVGDLLSLPLPGAKVYHRSTAIVSAVIVPTAADLAYGLQFHADRQVVTGLANRQNFLRVESQYNLPPDQRRLQGFNQLMIDCFAVQPEKTDKDYKSCFARTFDDVAPDR